MIGCRDGERNLAGDPGARPQPPVPAGAGQPNSPVADARETVLFVGTSLTAGLGVSEQESFPALIQEKIDAARLPFQVVNAGVSGETSAGALRRVEWLLRQPFAVVVLETGANDMLRGLDPEATESNIQAFMDQVRAARPEAQVILAGMLALPNLGADYVERFEAIYPRLAERNEVRLVPFLLQGVAAERELNQADGIHPNPEGHRVIADVVWEVLEPALEEEAASVAP